MRTKITSLLSSLCAPSLVSFIIAAPPALAADGVLEINQTCAIQTGCFAGDAAGLPVTIDGSAGRSYRLTSDLVVPGENTDGIVVSTDDIGIDLNNFTIRGPVTCSGTPLTCTPASGTGSGVERTSQSLTGISVRNGSVRGMGSSGVLLGVQAEVRDLRVRSNRISGVVVSDGSSVSDITAYQNGADGINTGGGSTIFGSTSYENGDDGVSSLSTSTISGNSVMRNDGAGIRAGVGSTILGNTAIQNETSGIESNAGTTIADNTAVLNGLHGISASSGCTVNGNTVRSNTGFGLSLGSQTGYRGNVITSNTAGTVTGSSLVNLGDNACNGTNVCP